MYCFRDCNLDGLTDEFPEVVVCLLGQFMSDAYFFSKVPILHTFGDTKNPLCIHRGASGRASFGSFAGGYFLFNQRS